MAVGVDDAQIGEDPIGRNDLGDDLCFGRH
jgi:hypothetical protein